MVTGELAEYLLGSTAGGLRDGVDGWLDDDLAFAKPWGFDVGDIRVPLALWQGEQDLMVPLAHGRWLAAHLPGVEATISAEDGHLSLVTRVDELHAWLLRQF